jgi:CRP-like cAMP-binding protein
VQVPGTAHRISTEDFIREIRDRPSPLNDLIAAYVHAFLMLTSITAACNRLHPIDQRFCRWLRMTYDRARRTDFPLRHEFLAQMLGVARPTLSTAASMLQKAGLINYRYGKLKLLDPDGLVAGACECYQIMNAQFDKIFDQPWRQKARNQEETAEER